MEDSTDNDNETNLDSCWLCLPRRASSGKHLQKGQACNKSDFTGQRTSTNRGDEGKSAEPRRRNRLKRDFFRRFLSRSYSDSAKSKSDSGGAQPRIKSSISTCSSIESIKNEATSQLSQVDLLLNTREVKSKSTSSSLCESSVVFSNQAVESVRPSRPSLTDYPECYGAKLELKATRSTFGGHVLLNETSAAILSKDNSNSAKAPFLPPQVLKQLTRQFSLGSKDKEEKDEATASRKKFRDVFKIMRSFDPSKYRTIGFFDCMDQLSEGDLVLFHTNRFTSKLQRTFVKSGGFDHVGIVVVSDDCSDEKCCPLELKEARRAAGIRAWHTLEADSSGVSLYRFTPTCLGAYRGVVCLRHLELDSQKFSRAMVHKALAEFVQTMNGRPYEKSMLQMVRAANIFGHNEEEDLSSVFCSELVAAAYSKLGLLHRDANRTSNSYIPGDFASKNADSQRAIRLVSGATLTKEVIVDCANMRLASKHAVHKEPTLSLDDLLAPDNAPNANVGSTLLPTGKMAASSPSPLSGLSSPTTDLGMLCKSKKPVPNNDEHVPKAHNCEQLGCSKNNENYVGESKDKRKLLTKHITASDRFSQLVVLEHLDHQRQTKGGGDQIERAAGFSSGYQEQQSPPAHLSSAATPMDGENGRSGVGNPKTVFRRTTSVVASHANPLRLTDLGVKPDGLGSVALPVCHQNSEGSDSANDDTTRKRKSSSESFARGTVSEVITLGQSQRHFQLVSAQENATLQIHFSFHTIKAEVAKTEEIKRRDLTCYVIGPINQDTLEHISELDSSDVMYEEKMNALLAKADTVLLLPVCQDQALVVETIKLADAGWYNIVWDNETIESSPIEVSFLLHID